MTRYLRRLIIESPYIYARLTNPGGSILLMPTSNPDQVSYGTQIGNDAHLDLIEAGATLKSDFSKGEIDQIIQWALGFTSQQAAEYNQVNGGAIMRKRRERLVAKLESRMNGAESRRTGRSDFEGRSDGHEPAQAGDSGQETPETSEQEGTVPRGDSREETKTE